MGDELDEGVSHEDAAVAARADHVGQAVDGEHEPEAAELDRLAEDVHPPPAGQALVPDGGQELLDVGVGHEGLLLALQGQLQAVQGLGLTWGPEKKSNIVSVFRGNKGL